jgi:hypothetical protein
MNRFLCALALSVAVVGVFLLAAGSAQATVVYSEDFETGMGGWDGDHPYWNQTDGQSGKSFAGYRNGWDPWLLAPAPLTGDIPSYFGSKEITFSYYLKGLANTPANEGGVFALYSGSTGDTCWERTPDDPSTPTDWRHITWSVDTSLSAAPAGWTRTVGSTSWADSWKDVKWMLFWSGHEYAASNIYNGIDTVVVSSTPEPASIVLVVTGVLGLLAYAWRKRK